MPKVGFVMRHVVFLSLLSLVTGLWAAQNRNTSPFLQPTGNTLREVRVEAHKAFRSVVRYVRELMDELED